MVGGSTSGGGLNAESAGALGNAVVDVDGGWLYLNTSPAGSPLTFGNRLLFEYGGSVVDRGSDTWSGPVILSSSGQMAAVSSATLTVSGQVSGSGPLTVNGQGDGSSPNGYFYGTVDLTSSTNTYSGGTAAPSGYLVAGAAGALGTGQVTTGDPSTSGGDATLEVACGCTVTNPVVAQGPGDGSLNGSLEAAANTAVTFTGPVHLNQDPDGPPNLVAGGGGSLTLSDEVFYSGSSPLQTSGSVTLSGTNGSTLTGGILVGSQATLTAAGDSGSLGSGTVELSDGSALRLQGVSPSAGLTALGVPFNPNDCGQVFFSTSLVDVTGGDTFAGPVDLGACDRLQLSDGGASPFLLIGPISGSGGLTVTGSAGDGPVRVDSTGTFTGPTTVSSGVLGGTGSLPSVSVSSGAMLAPGVPTGTLSVGGPVSFSSGSTFAVTLNSPSSGGFSQLSVSGTSAPVVSGASLEVVSGQGFVARYGDRYDVLVNGSGSAVSGTFANQPEGSVLKVGSTVFEVTYRGGVSGRDVVLTVVSGAPVAVLPSGPVPPPAPPGAVSSASGVSPAGGGPVSVSLPPLSVSAPSGVGAVTIASYGGDPEPAAPAGASPVYFDVRLASGSGFPSLTVTECAVAAGSKMVWWDPAALAWQPVSPAATFSGGCLSFVVGPSSSPSLADLTGTVFAVVAPVSVGSRPVTSPSGAGRLASGYRLVGADGGVFGFGGAGFYGSAAGYRLGGPVVAVASTPDGDGYWLVGADGGVFGFGGAGFYGSAAGYRLGGPVVAVASTPDGKGYWLVGADGGVFGFGDASFYGSAAGRLATAAVGIAATPDGHGYWVVDRSGDVLAFGDAPTLGSLSGAVLAAPIVGMAATADGHGYWLGGADGGVFGFGDAGFFGSASSSRLDGPIVGIEAAPDGHGYRLAGADGGVFGFGDAPYAGSAAGLPLDARITAIG